MNTHNYGTMRIIIRLLVLFSQLSWTVPCNTLTKYIVNESVYTAETCTNEHCGIYIELHANNFFVLFGLVLQ